MLGNCRYGHLFFPQHLITFGFSISWSFFCVFLFCLRFVATFRRFEVTCWQHVDKIGNIWQQNRQHLPPNHGYSPIGEIRTKLLKLYHFHWFFEAPGVPAGIFLTICGFKTTQQALFEIPVVGGAPGGLNSKKIAISVDNKPTIRQKIEKWFAYLH